MRFHAFVAIAANTLSTVSRRSNVKYKGSHLLVVLADLSRLSGWRTFRAPMTAKCSAQSTVAIASTASIRGGHKDNRHLPYRNVQTGILRMKRAGFDQGNTVGVAAIGCQHRQISCVVTAREEDMFALIIISKQAEHFCHGQRGISRRDARSTSDFIVRAFFLIPSIHVVEEVLRPGETGGKR